MSTEAQAAELEMLTRFRRDLHRIPELDFDLPETISYVTAELERLRETVCEKHGEEACEVVSPCKSAVCIIFNRKAAFTTGFRTDMDALPVTERSHAEFASRHDGKMHACGHDGHMAMALALANHLADRFDELPRNIMVVFQPAEETTGGANFICRSGVFERYNVDRMFGFHLWPDLPAGTIASRPGALLAAASESTFTFHGKAAHIAKAADGADALEAGARFLLDAYAYMDERRKEEPCLLKCGFMRSGDVRNVISSYTRIEGSLRTFSEEMGARAKRELAEIAQQRAEEAGCTVEAHFADGYPPVVNDPELFDAAAKAVENIEELPDPLLIGEDFAFYQRYLPGVFLLLGTGTGIPLHADTFDFDERVLLNGLDAYKKLALMP